MDPAIFDTSSPWSYLWLISSAAVVIGWAFFIAAALAAAALMPYLVGRLVGSWVRARSAPKTGTRTNRTLVPAAIAVIVLIGTAVVGLAYAAGALR